MDVDESAPQADPNYGGGSTVDKLEEREWLRDEKGKHCWLYWLDAVEQSGSVYLLGKIRLEGDEDRYASCCCVVRNVERSFFVLPRVDAETGQRYGMKDVWEEARSELVPRCDLGVPRRCLHTMRRLQKKWVVSSSISGPFGPSMLRAGACPSPSPSSARVLKEATPSATTTCPATRTRST